ncbi:MAG: hypothetical protein ACKVQK_22965 [Burkholderiales bacterium]
MPGYQQLSGLIQFHISCFYRSVFALLQFSTPVSHAGLIMQTALKLLVKQPKKPATKKPTAKPAPRGTDIVNLSPDVQEIVRLARRLKGSFGPT